MENIEMKLNDYRFKKRSQRHLPLKGRMLSFFFPNGETINFMDEKNGVADDTLEISDTGKSKNRLDEKNLVDMSTSDKLLIYTLWFVYLGFWISLYMIAIKLGFGIVFLTLSAFVAIYFNTRTDRKSVCEVSAYSVFNINCESIDGTLKAEHFEHQMGIR